MAQPKEWSLGEFHLKPNIYFFMISPHPISKVTSVCIAHLKATEVDPKCFPVVADGLKTQVGGPEIHVINTNCYLKRGKIKTRMSKRKIMDKSCRKKTNRGSLQTGDSRICGSAACLPLVLRRMGDWQELLRRWPGWLWDRLQKDWFWNRFCISLSPAATFGNSSRNGWIGKPIPRKLLWRLAMVPIKAALQNSADLLFKDQRSIQQNIFKDLWWCGQGLRPYLDSRVTV